MNGNFNEKQNLKHGDRTVDTRGWLEWAEDDDFAEITITVMQDGDGCDGPSFTCAPPGTEWRVEVTRAAPPWSRGAAAGRATATVTKKDGSSEGVIWDSPPLRLR